jgi:hypothetical protein
VAVHRREEEEDKLTIEVVDECRLAHRVLVLGRRVAKVVTRLTTTDEVLGIRLVGLSSGIRIQLAITANPLGTTRPNQQV